MSASRVSSESDLLETKTPKTVFVRARARRLVLVCLVFFIALIAGIIFSAMAGQLTIHPTEVLGSIARAIGFDNSWVPKEEIVEKALWQIRFPRIVMGILVGATLSVAGAIMQAIFGNPLAEPGVVGVSSGAALGAAFAIVAGVTMFGAGGVALFAFLGGLGATMLVYSMARSRGRTEVVTLLLTGIAINAFCGAGLAFTMFVGNVASREEIIFWQLGSVNGTRWFEVLIVAVVGFPAIAMTFTLARKYDLLSLGEVTAAHLGVRVERLRIISIILVALLTGVGVAFVGIVAFVGLVVPHLIRMMIGPAHRSLILVSTLGGAVLLVFADLAARTLVGGADLPIGMLTSLIGGPFFFYLIRKARSSAGGWA